MPWADDAGGNLTAGSANFVGDFPDIPEVYDRDSGPYIFEYFADDLAKRAAALEPLRVLEIAAGAGVVTRKLRRGQPGSHYRSAD